MIKLVLSGPLKSGRTQSSIFEGSIFPIPNFHPFLGSPGQCDGAFDQGPAAGTGKSQGGRQVGRNRQCEAGTGTI